MRFTTRQLRTAAAYGDADHWPTQSQLAKAWGITQSAVSRRLRRFIDKLTPSQAKAFRRRTRKGYRKALAAGGKRVKLRLMQLSLAVGV